LDLAPGRQPWKILFWGALAYFWSMINDDPVNADLLLAKPPHPGYYLMEVVLNLLSLICFCLAAREALKGQNFRNLRVKVALWTILAFLWSSSDDIPFLKDGLGLSSITSEYYYDVVKWSVSLFFFYLAIRRSTVQDPRVEKARKVPTTEVPPDKRAPGRCLGTTTQADVMALVVTRSIPLPVQQGPL
jgi:hypothetical protein